MREIYADHAATTRPAPEVVQAMLPFLEEGFGNASSVHHRGEAARDAIEGARAQVAAFVGALPEEIVFTASGSESNSLALTGVLRAVRNGRRRLIVSAIEHPSVLETARQLEAEGFEITVLPVDAHGRVEPASLASALGPDVALVSIMAINNEIGTRQPVAELARLAHGAGALIHCDAVQAAGKVPLDVAALGVDLLSIAGHKFEGPPGAAALHVRRRVRLEPLIVGGHQERSRRAGTENLPAIVGLGVAAERAGAWLAGGGPGALAALGERLARGLCAAIPGARVNADGPARHPAILSLCIESVDGEAVLHELDRAGITISTGSACSAASPGPSHVLIALGLDPEDAHASVRFSLGPDTTVTDIQHIEDVTPGIVERLRALDSNSAQHSA